MLATASIASEFGTAVGVLAGMIAVGGFLGHAGLVLGDASDRRIQQATVIGGMGGCFIGLLVVVLSAIVGILAP